MRYEIDWEHEIVDFYVEDDSGREHHSGLGFDEAKEMFGELKGEIEKFSDLKDFLQYLLDCHCLDEGMEYVDWGNFIRKYLVRKPLVK